MSGRLRIYSATVLPDWIDYNDHMTEGYYGVAFADASDEFLLHIGFDAEYRDQQRGSFYTVETFTRFIRELNAGDSLEFETIVLGADAKRLHLFHTMLHGGDRYEAATQEVMLLHVDLDTTKVRPMADGLVEAIGAIAADHAAIARPASVGRHIRGIPSDHEPK